MKKRLWLRLGILSLVFILAGLTTTTQMVQAANTALVTDGANLLTREETRQLNDLAQEIAAQYQCDVAIVTAADMVGDDAYAFAKSIYEKNGYGYGPEKSGLLLFLSMKERDYALIAHGYGNTAFTDHGKDVLLDRHILPLLGDDKYYAAFSLYLSTASEYLSMAHTGKPFDLDTDEVLLAKKARTSNLIKWVVCIFGPLLLATIVCLVFKRQMKSATPAQFADHYIPDGGFQVTMQEDQFLYQTETRRKIKSQSPPSGGTSVDSSGYSGRSGKF